MTNMLDKDKTVFWGNYETVNNGKFNMFNLLAFCVAHDYKNYLQKLKKCNDKVVRLIETSPYLKDITISIDVNGSIIIPERDIRRAITNGIYKYYKLENKPKEEIQEETVNSTIL